MGDRPAQTHTEGFMRSILPLSGGKDLPGQGPLAAGPDVAALAQRWLPNHALDDGSQPAGSGGRPGVKAAASSMLIVPVGGAACLATI